MISENATSTKERKRDRFRLCLSEIPGLISGTISRVTFTTIDCTPELTVDIIAAKSAAQKQAVIGLGMTVISQPVALEAVSRFGFIALIVMPVKTAQINARKETTAEIIRLVLTFFSFSIAQMR